jgi:hypothetical protein
MVCKGGMDIVFQPVEKASVPDLFYKIGNELSGVRNSCDYHAAKLRSLSGLSCVKDHKTIFPLYGSTFPVRCPGRKRGW